MSNEEGPIVHIKQGILRGKTDLDCKGRIYYSFQGIPYAKPPIGNLRFKAPQSPDPWTGVRDATKEGSECYSRHFFFKNIIGSEDCLFVNVYSPKITENPSELKPVLFWVHGGGFVGGSGNSEFYGPSNLLPEDVVLVTFNYRVGVLGFLSLDDPAAGMSGNTGLKDQVMALKWVQHNISKFGGDPNNVTIFGESAGGASIHFLVLSPMSRGLFHKAIAQSGCAINSWALKTIPNDKEYIKLLGCDSNDVQVILKFLSKVSCEKILTTQEQFFKEKGNSTEFVPIGPRIENPCVFEQTFLTEHPETIMKQGTFNHVPFMAGCVRDEGLLFTSPSFGVRILPTFSDEAALPINLKFQRSDHKEVGKQIKRFYYGNKEPSESDKDEFVKLNTDRFFSHGVYSSMRIHAKISTQPVYSYLFTYETDLNVIGHIFPEMKGCAHADEIGYLFSSNFAIPFEDGSREQIAKDIVVKLWTTFAKTGNPNPTDNDPYIKVKWEPVEKTQFNYLEIGEPLKSINGRRPFEERLQFWDELFKTKTCYISKI